MKKQFPIAIFIFLGVILASISFINHKNQVINIYDTYYIISSSDFGIVLLLLFLIPAILSFTFQKFVSKKLLWIQLLFFALPIIYFMIYDIVTQHYSPGYYFAHPFLFELQTVYLPIGFLVIFLVSILLLIFNSIYSVVKFIKN
ncbi:hypothetical protein C8C85_0159 [Flavobacterium sp. 103]|uniref:hypothetical protein n=1 Tax=Flavobacterium sp. 103 TaxID=2135624 RepID=UPI000D5EC667|nr:hypothetical protein [Flavobacterium sp. 103]PVX44426.1 hypothetical protein C8C85_0159 [Flavobacterium sp. 103]